jgi:hypothetical protein
MIMPDTAVDPLTALADYQFTVWRYAATEYEDRGTEFGDNLRELGLPDEGADNDEALAAIQAGVRALRAEDVPDLLARFKAGVRAAAIRIARDNGYCNYGLNQALDELGLEGWDGARGTVTATVRLRDSATDRPAPLTAQTLTPLLRLETDDDELEFVSAPTVTELVVADAADPTVLRATVQFEVWVDTLDPDEAQTWIARYIAVVPYSRHVGLDHIVDQSWAIGPFATVAWDDDPAATLAAVGLPTESPAH